MLSLLAAVMKNMQAKKEEEKPPPTPDISALLGLLGKGISEKPKEDTAVTRIFGSKDDMKNRIALLNAVKPYLNDERRDKLDSVVKLMRLTELGELGALLSKM